MNKKDAVIMSYQIATMTYPSSMVLDLLMPLAYERTLELLLIMRQSPKPVKSPLNFLRRAVDECWTAETMPEQVNRHTENIEERFYLRKGYTLEQARLKIQQNKKDLDHFKSSVY